jgi:EmrB/QacA subfamily drug resistance transporter
VPSQDDLRDEQSVQRPTETSASFAWTARHVAALVVLCVAQVLDGIDVTVVNVALPSIENDLGFTPQSLPWVVNAYMVFFGGFLLLSGRAGDLLGRRKVFLAGLVLFTVASLVSGLATGIGTLLSARAAQGVAAAMIAPMTLALIAVTFPRGRPRTVALAFWGAAYGVSGALGLLVGGLLVGGPGWRWIFFVNVPIGLLVLVVALWIVPADRPVRRHHAFDVVGAVTSTAGTGLLAYAVLRAGADGWASVGTGVGLAAALVLLGYFVVHETRLAREPLLAFALFRSRSLTGANLVTAVRGAAMFAVFYFLTLYQQQVLHQSALETGLAYLPLTLTLVVAAGAGAALVRRFGIRPVLVVGSLVAAAGLGLFTRLPVQGSLLWNVVVPSVILSLGFAVMIVPTTIAALSDVPASHAGIGSALLNVSLQVGGALGLSALATAATTRTATQLDAGLARDVALVDGFGVAFVVAAGLMVVTALMSVGFFGARGRAQAVDVTQLQKAELDV